MRLPFGLRPMRTAFRPIAWRQYGLWRRLCARPPRGVVTPLGILRAYTAADASIATNAPRIARDNRGQQMDAGVLVANCGRILWDTPREPTRQPAPYPNKLGLDTLLPFRHPSS